MAPWCAPPPKHLLSRQNRSTLRSRSWRTSSPLRGPKRRTVALIPVCSAKAHAMPCVTSSHWRTPSSLMRRGQNTLTPTRLASSTDASAWLKRRLHLRKQQLRPHLLAHQRRSRHKAQPKRPMAKPSRQPSNASRVRLRLRRSSTWHRRKSMPCQRRTWLSRQRRTIPSTRRSAPSRGSMPPAWPRCWVRSFMVTRPTWVRSALRKFSRTRSTLPALPCGTAWSSAVRSTSASQRTAAL